VKTSRMSLKRCCESPRTFFCLTILIASVSLVPVRAWSNGGWSTDPNNPDYGTHDWLAHHALDWVPDSLDFWIRNNLAIYLYGTELPDNSKAVLNDGIGDTALHHVYYRSNGELQDDASARRAREACNQVRSYLTVKDYRNAAKWMGIVTHYVSDLAVFGHVMGSNTDWGSEKHHGDYEDWVNARTDRYDSTFVTYLRFDGKLDAITAYDAALRLALDTTFDSTGKARTAKWMDDNYNPTNLSYQERIGESLNLAVNLLADVIYSISQTGQVTTTATATTATSTVTSPLTTTTTVTTSPSTSGTTVTTTTTYTTTSSPVLTLTTTAPTTATQTLPTTTHTSTATSLTSSTSVTTTTGQTTSTSFYSTSLTQTTTLTTSMTSTSRSTTTTTQSMSSSTASTSPTITASRTVPTQTTTADRVAPIVSALFLVICVLLVGLGISRVRNRSRGRFKESVGAWFGDNRTQATLSQNFCGRCGMWSPGSYCPQCGQKLV